MAAMLGFANIDVWAANISSNGTGGGSWNSTTTWAGAVVPTSADNVTIVSGDVIIVNTNPQIIDLTVTSGTVKPDVGTRTITIDGNLTLTAGTIDYVNSTGTLSWAFTGASTGTTTIDNILDDYTKMKFYNVTVSGGQTQVTAAGADFTVYGNFSVTTGVFNATAGVVYFQNTVAKTITNSSACTFYGIQTIAGSSVTTVSDLTVSNKIWTEATSAFTANSPSAITTGAMDIKNLGTLTFASGSSLVTAGNVSINSAGNDITGFAGSLTLSAANSLTLGAKVISGTGSFTSGALSTISLINASGVAAALNLTGTRSFSTTMNVTFTAGASATGFTYSSGNNVVSVQNFTHTGTVTTAETFTVVGTINGAGTFTASAGTITFSTGGTTIGGGGGAQTFFNLALTHVAGTTTLGQAITVSGGLSNLAGGTLAFSTFVVTMNGTGTLSLAGTHTFGIAGGITINTTGTITNAANIAGGAQGIFTLTAGTLDMAATSYTSGIANGAVITAGTIKSSKTTGFIGNFPNAANGYVSVASGVNFEFNGVNTQTDFGFFSAGGFTLSGTGVTGDEVTSVGSITVTGGATAALSPAIVTFGSTYTQTLTVAGDIIVTGATLITIPYHATDNLLTLSGAAKVITIASTATVQFNNLIVGGTRTTSSNFTVANILNATGSLIASTPSIITLSNGSGGALVSPVNGGTLTFYDLAFTSANNNIPGTSFTVAGNLVFNGAGTFAATAGVVTMSGTSKYIYKGVGAGTVTFFGLTVSGTVTAPALSATPVTAAGQTMVSTIVSSFSILGTGTLTVSGTLTAGSLQVTTFAGAGTLAGAGTKTFYDLTWAGAVSSAVTLTVTNDLTGSAVWTQSASTFTMTAADGGALINTAAAANLVVSGGELALAPSAASGTYTMDANDGVTPSGGVMFVYSNATLSINGTLQPTITGAGTFQTGSGAQVEFGTGGNFGLATTINTTTKTIHANTDLVIGAACLTTADLSVAALQTWRNVQIASTGLLAMGGDISVSGNFQTMAAGSYVQAPVTQIVTMTGTSKSIINGNTNLTFGKLVIATGATITSASNFRTGSILVTALDVQGTGSLICSAGTYGLAGAAAGAQGITVASTATLNLFNFTVDPGAVNGVTASIPASTAFTVSGAMTMGSATSVLTSNATSTITFAGATAAITPAASFVAATSGIQFGDVEFTGTKTQTGDFIMKVVGTTFEVTSTGNFTPGTGTIEFNNASASSTVTIINDGTLAFNNLTTGTAAASVLTTADDFTVAGNMTLSVADTYWQTDGVLSLSGATSAITVAATAVPATPVGMILNDLTVKASATGATTSGAFIIDVRGDITVEALGSMVMAATGTTNFATGTTKVITNAGTLTFGVFSLANVASNNVTTASDFTVAGASMANVGTTGGTFVASAGTVSISHATGNVTNLNSNSAAAMTFYGLNFTGADTDFDVANGGREMYVKGNLTFTSAATFVAGAGSKIWMNGTAEQTITANATGTVDIQNMTVNNSAGVKLVSAATAGNFTFNKTLRLQSGDFDLNGDNIVEIDPTAGLLSETPGNTIKNTGVVTAVGYVYITNTANTALTANNLGGLGAQITTAISPGATITVKRSHISKTVGTSTGISRFYEIASAVTTGLNSTLTFKYDDSELGSLTESALSLVNSTLTTGPWNYVTVNSQDATNNYLRVTALDGYSGVRSFWTAASPSVVTLSTLTSGVETTPLTAGHLAKAIAGIQLSSSGAVTANTIKFNFSRALAGTEFTNFKLYLSSDNDYSTTSDNTLVTTSTAGGTVADNYVTLTLTDNNSLVNGTPMNYFLIADVSTAVTAATTVITLSQTNADVTVTDGVVKTVSLTGSSFLFQPGLMIEALNKGITPTPMVAGTSNNAVIGFAISGTSAASITGFTVATSADATSTLENIKLYSSTDNDYSTSVDNTQITLLTTTAATTGYTLTFASQTVLTTAKYYFVVAGVKSAVVGSATAIQPTIAHSSFVSTTAGKRLTDLGAVASTSVSGISYEFVKNGATVTSNLPATGNLSRSVRDLPVFGFTITPDNANTTAFTAVSMDATFGSSATSADVTAYKLGYDANENGFLDAGELISTGVYTAAATTGNLVFSGFGTAQSFTAARKYIVTVNVASTATASGTLVVSMASERNLTMTSPTKPAAFGPFTGNTQTFRTPVAASKLVIVGRGTATITTGGTIAFTVQAQDLSGYPANVTSNETVTIANAINATIGGTTTGTILSGTNFITVTPSLTYASGTTSELVSATGSSLTTSPTSTGIKILVAQPTTQSTNIVLGTPLVTTIPVTSAVSGNGAARLLVIRQGLPPAAPTDGTSYTATTNVKDATSGSQTGPGSYVVYNSTSAVGAFNITGLTPGVEYFLQVFEFNGTAASGLENYLATNSFTSYTSPTSSVQNPKSSTTASGSLGTIATALTAASIATDANVAGAVSAATDTLYYQFVVNTSKRNVMVRLSGLPKNYTLELYDATASVSAMVLLRSSQILSTGTETVILKNATAGNYVIKVFSADGTYSSTNYNVRVTTSANEIMSQPN
jgi:hypothetical protein